MILTDLRSGFANAKCKDPRDYIFAVSSMLNPTERGICPSPDYDMPVMEVYREVMLRYLSKYRSINLLRQCELPNDASWPSWVPDWSVPTATERIDSDTILATSKIMAWYDVIEVSVLSVAGVAVDVVSVVVDVPAQFKNVKGTYDWIHGLLGSQDLDTKHVTGCRLLEAYARTLVCDKIKYVYGTSHRLPSLEDAISATKYIYEHAHYDKNVFRPDTPWGFFLDIVYHSQCKKFIRTMEGYIGVATPHTEVGDQICVLLGLDAPIVLRAVGASRYRVVGESYIHGISQGEMILGPLPENMILTGVLEEETDVYPMAFVDLMTGSVSFMDPRMNALPLDLGGYKKRLLETPYARIDIHPDVLIQHGVDIKYFDLV
jgi:hypothetical protein